MDNSTCSIAGCGKRHFAKFLCNMHYSRLRVTGTTALRPKIAKSCRMPSCSKPSRKLGWCSGHHSRIKRTGSPFDEHQAWVIGERLECAVCGRIVPEDVGFRRYCGRSCAVMAHRGSRQAHKPCATCGDLIDLTRQSDSGRMKYSSASYCDGCRKGVNLRAFVPKLAKAKGTDCSLCSGSIDMSLQYPDMMSRSVDHIIPRSLGGPETMENLTLTHLLCNIRKQNRLDYIAI